jgi:hypothetical protein
MKGSNSYKMQQKPTFRPKPLSIEQMNAVELLIVGKADAEVAEAVGVDRSTVWTWRTSNPLFMATLQERRAELYRSMTERLRSGLGKAVENLISAVDSGDLKASLELLKCCAVYGDGAMHHIKEMDPEKLFHEQVTKRLAQERIPDQFDHLIDPLRNPGKERRRAEIEAELRAKYSEQE